MSDHDDDASDINNDNAQPQQQQNIQPQIITTVSNNNAKFPYLKKDEYEVWAMKMEYWITNNDMNIWKVIQNGNSLKRTGRDRDGRVIILPPTTADEHIAVQRESKARTTLLQSIPDDHVADFHYMDDARDIWNAVKARFGGNAESKKMRKSMLKQEFSEFRISESEGLHKGYDRMQKILSQLNQLKAKPDDEDINLKFLKGLPSSWSQVALTLKTKGGLELLSFDDLYYKLKTLEIDIKGYSTHSSSQSPSHSAFVSTTSTSKKMSYHLLLTLLHEVLKLDLTVLKRWISNGKKAGRKIEFDKKESARFNKKAVRCYKCLQKGHFARECRAKGGNEKRYSSFKIQELGKKEADTKALITVDTLENWKEHESGDDEGFAPKEYGMVAGYGAACEESAAEVYSLITRNGTDAAAGEFALMGMTSEIAKKDLQTKLDNHLAKSEKWTSSSKNLFRLIDSSMSIRTKVGLGFDKYIGESELGWDDSEFSIFTPKSEEVEGRPLFHKFTKADGMKAVPPPLSGNYIPLSDTTDLDETQMTYGKKSTCSINSISVSCDNSDKSSEIKSNDYAFCVSSVKSSEPITTDSSSNTSTSSVSTHASEANLESSKGTTIQEPIIVQELLSFSCTDKDVKTSKTPCNKNGYFNKKASHFRKNNSSASKEPIWDNTTRVTQSNQFIPQAILLRSGKVSIPVARPNQVPAGRPKPVSTSKQNKPPPVHAGRRNSLVTSGWWQSTARPMTYLPTPTSSYFQTSTPFGPHVNLYTNAGDEGIVDSGCSCSMTGNKERFDDFQPFKGGKITFGKADEGYLVGYSASNRAYMLYNMANKRVEETMNLRFLEEKANIQGIGHEWSFDLDYLTDSLGYNRDKATQSAVGAITVGFCWVFFLETKDETYPSLRDFISLIENQLNKKILSKIGCRRGKIEPIEAAITKLADSKSYPTNFFVTDSCDEGYLVGYSASNRAYRDEKNRSSKGGWKSPLLREKGFLYSTHWDIVPLDL
ncbi:putative ribonuclease H-like domain-containing protein [Tanacetum coccineum]